MDKKRTDDEVMALEGVPQIFEDKLENMVEAQRKFMDKLGTPALDHRAGKLGATDFVKMLTAYTQTCTTAINCETTELLDALPWKPWRKTHKDVDLANVHIEIIDILHFSIQLALIWGLTAQEIHDIFMKKMQENLDRQEKGY